MPGSSTVAAGNVSKGKFVVVPLQQNPPGPLSDQLTVVSSHSSPVSGFSQPKNPEMVTSAAGQGITGVGGPWAQNSW